jgi:pimeloyl-ACP methyl ester carboxylesterase
MGGAIALLTALYHPEHLPGLVFVDTGARLPVDPVLLRDAREAVLRGRSAGSDRGGPSLEARPKRWLTPWTR